MIQKLKQNWPILALAFAILIAFYPSILLGKIPLNGNQIVGFFSPWVYQKQAGYPAGVPFKPSIPDQLRIYYPYMQLTRQSYRLGQIPLWNPYNFAGNPHMAEWQSGAFYPLHIFLPLLPLALYWTIYQMLGLFLAGLFTYLYLRQLRLSQLASLFGGLTFSLSTFMFTWNTEVIPAPHSILWLPAMLLLVDKFLVKRQWRYWLMLIGSGVLSILSGYWQTTFYVLVVVGLYMLVRSLLVFPEGVKQKASSKLVLLLLLVFPAIAGLTAFHLLPTLELYQRSSRPTLNASPEIIADHKNFLLRTHQLATLLAPDFFGHPTTRNHFSYSRGFYYERALFVGVVPLMLLPLISLIKKNRSKKLLWFFAGLTIFAGSFAFDLPHSRWVFDAKIPLLSTGIANRILFIPAFFLSILAAFALQAWLKANAKNRRHQTIKTLFIGGLIFAILWLFLWQIAPILPFDPKSFPINWFNIARRNSIISTGVFLAAVVILLLGIWKKRFLAASALLLIAGSSLQNLYQFQKFTPFSEPRFTYPSHPAIKFLQDNAGINRYLGYNGVFLNYNFATYLNLFTVEGYDSLNDMRRSQLLFAAQENGKITNLLPRSVDVALSRNLTDDNVLRLMQLAGIKYLVDHPEFPDSLNKSSQPTLPEGKQKLVFTNDDWKIYEYTDAFPRAFLVGDYRVETDDQKTADFIFSPEINLRETVILAQEPEIGELKRDTSATVEVISYTPNKILFHTQSATSQILFLSDTYYPGWKAEIDGASTDVLQANYAFRAIPVPAGQHTIEMYYLPESFTNGLWLAAAAVTAIFLTTKFVKLK